MNKLNVALVCIAKNEDSYIKEWVEYYIKLGFDKIFIYQNNWRTDYVHDNVVKIEFDGDARQVIAYNHWLIDHRNHFDWAAFFDMDEFLVLKKHNTIKEFLLEYSNYNGIGINWYMFGNNGHEKVIDNEYSLIKRFTKRQNKMNEHVKTILNCKFNSTMSVHNPNNVSIVSPNGIEFRGPFNYNTNDEIAQINHYYCKTPEEFIKKCERGRADTLQHRLTFNQNYHIVNFNDVEDLSAYHFMYNN